MAKKKVVKRSVKKSTKKSSKKLPVKKVNVSKKKSSVKKKSSKMLPVKKVVKKVNVSKKKSSKKLPVKKAVKKASPSKKKPLIKSKVSKPKQKASRSKKSSSMVLVCAACGSPRVNNVGTVAQPMYVCDRCGYKSSTILSVPVSKVRKTLATRHKEIKRHHLAKVKKRVTTTTHFHKNFELRVWISVIGLFLLVGGVVLLSTPEMISGVLFACIGLIMAIASYRL